MASSHTHTRIHTHPRARTGAELRREHLGVVGRSERVGALLRPVAGLPLGGGVASHQRGRAPDPGCDQGRGSRITTRSSARGALDHGAWVGGGVGVLGGGGSMSAWWPSVDCQKVCLTPHSPHPPTHPRPAPLVGHGVQAVAVVRDPCADTLTPTHLPYTHTHPHTHTPTHPLTHTPTHPLGLRCQLQIQLYNTGVGTEQSEPNQPKSNQTKP